ncbi:uncharacterized protein LOC110683531 [Chenopodium quinoa]|uniref:uncharacterized protein LOC110683531 n=1 Tax=Chenopodium quinoa TaxID=63459 RepID=UPI000B778979|nr:uncharacterized protein LOC110683531 [Chenopodium quinoa]
MSLSLSSIKCKPLPCPQISSTVTYLQPIIRIQTRTRTRTDGFASKCELNEQSFPKETTKKDASKLSVGSPVIITEAPQMIKTAASVPCLRLNTGLVNTGDVGRIISRKPMDVWAIRLSIGTYLIDRKYFKPLELDE